MEKILIALLVFFAFKALTTAVKAQADPNASPSAILSAPTPVISGQPASSPTPPNSLTPAPSVAPTQSLSPTSSPTATPDDSAPTATPQPGPSTTPGPTKNPTPTITLTPTPISTPTPTPFIRIFPLSSFFQENPHPYQYSSEVNLTKNSVITIAAAAAIFIILGSLLLSK